jgi:phosphate transport system substrate-binding protein
MRYPWLAAITAGALALGVAACGGDDESGSGTNGGGDLSGAIAVDGSSTVFPFAQAAAEGFQTENSGVQVTVGESGTGGGFEKFCAGETDIATASRPIDTEEEVPVCEKNGVTFAEVIVANDGISVVSNKALEIGCISVEQLAKLWGPDSKITNYSQLGDQPDGKPFPDAEVSLYGPGTDSGTFDFFTEEVVGEKGATRKDYQPSEDDNVLVQGVEGDKNGLGYFGFSYYEDNADKLNLISVDSGDGCVTPSKETIQDQSYKPLSRELFMYPSQKSLSEKPQVKGFMEYTVSNEGSLAETAQIVPLTSEQQTTSKDELAKASGGGTATTE